MKEYPYWKFRENNFAGQNHIGAQYRILMPQNEDTIIYDFFRSKPFDRYYAMVNGLDRMTIGLWENIRLRELVRFSSNIGFIIFLYILYPKEILFGYLFPLFKLQHSFFLHNQMRCIWDSLGGLLSVNCNLFFMGFYSYF